MNSPEDDIPLPSEPVLTEGETAEQLRRDFCRGYIDEAKRWKIRAEAAERTLAARTDALVKCRVMIGRFLVPWKHRISDSWLSGFEETGCVIFDEIGFVKPKPIEDEAGKDYVPRAELDLATFDACKARQDRDNATREMDACHKCWDDFTATVVKALPDMARAPLFSQADRIVSEIKALRRTLELARDAFRDISANLTQPPIPLRSGLTAVQLAEICDLAIKGKQV